jgi:hypothetical protein
MARHGRLIGRQEGLAPADFGGGRAEFEGAREEGELFLLTMHPHVIGHRSRMPLLSRLVNHMKQRGGCWFAAHAQVGEWCHDQATPLL